MTLSDLLVISGTALIAVFLLLTILALIMRLIVFIYPEKDHGIDGAIIAAITTAYKSLYPTTKIAEIKEAK